MKDLEIPNFCVKLETIRESFYYYLNINYITIKEYAFSLSESDPNFFRWLYGYENTETLNDFVDPSPENTKFFFDSL